MQEFVVCAFFEIDIAGMQKGFSKTTKLEITLILIAAIVLCALPSLSETVKAAAEFPARNNNSNPHSMPPGLAKKLLDKGLNSQKPPVSSTSQLNRIITTINLNGNASVSQKKLKPQDDDWLLKGSSKGIGNLKFNRLKTDLVSVETNEAVSKKGLEATKMQLSKVGEQVSFKPGISASLETDFKQLVNEGLPKGASQTSTTNFKQQASNYQNWLEQCFSADTLVTLADGSAKKITDIKVGDSVLSYDRITKSYLPKKVLKTFRKEASDLRSIEIANGSHLEVTSEHPFWLAGEWVPAISLKPNDKLMNRFGEPVLVRSNLPLKGRRAVYNLEVEDNNNYLAQGVLVHNLCVLRDGHLTHLSADLELKAADVPLPNLSELEFPVVKYLRSNPQQGHLVGEHPEIASNIVAGVIGLTQENLKMAEAKFSPGEFTPKFVKNLIFELVMLTLNFGPSATTEFMQYVQNDSSPLLDNKLLNYIERNPVLSQWLKLNRGVSKLKI